MDKYQFSEPLEHCIQTSAIKQLSFELINIFKANKEICNSFESGFEELQNEGIDLNIEDDCILELHNEISFAKISELILRIAIMVRIFDEQQIRDNITAERYVEYRKKCEANLCESNVRVNNIRYYSNKIIHAVTIRPLSEELESGNEDLRLFHLTGEIDLSGEFPEGKVWGETIYIEYYLSAILELIKWEDKRLYKSA
jgi:hypothetical protein